MEKQDMYKILDDFFEDNYKNLSLEEKRIFTPLFERIHLKLTQRISNFNEITI
jgi:succinate dehydrogenase flavin-adding protein (antitoxin of CptAB toxin-antitoxin module)